MVKSTAAALLVLWASVSWTGSTRADRPGSYDRILGGPNQRAAAGPHHHNAGTRHGGFWRPGPFVSGYGWLGHPRSLSFYVGVGPGYTYAPWFGYGTYSPGWTYGYGGPSGVYFDSASNFAEYYLPPIYAPAELTYGPRAIERFLGVRSDAAVMAPPAVAAPKSLPATGVATKLRTSNASSRERARRFVAFGDALFLKQRFHEAVQRYKSGIEAAPDLPEIYYRQGFGLIAVRQFRLAARALRIAVELDPAMAGKGIQLELLYGDNRIAKSAHLEQLVEEALDRPGDGDMLFLVGMFLYCDGEADRARKFLQKAADLAGPEVTFLAPLLGLSSAPDADPGSTPAEGKAAERDI